MKADLEDEKRQLQGKIHEPVPEKEEFEHEQKELEKVCNPIITKLYQSAAGMSGGMPGDFPGDGAPPSGGASSGPPLK
ncbi:hypothetical protein GH733_008855, partial [Mirounga leonina]